MTFFNPIAAGSAALYPKGAAFDSAALIVASSWADRPTEPDGLNDGDWLLLDPSTSTGAVYRWWAAEERWIRPVIYEGSPTKLMEITGAVTPANESPAWTDNTSGSGTITSDGVRVTWDGVDGSSTAYSTYTHSDTTNPLWFQGLWQVVHGTTYGAQAIIQDGSKNMNVDTDGTQFIFSGISNPIPIDPSSKEYLVEALLLPTGTFAGGYLWVDNSREVIALVDYAGMTGTAGELFRAGIFAAAVDDSMTLRDAVFGRLGG